MNKVDARRARLVPGWVHRVVGIGYTICACNQPTRSTQPCGRTAWMDDIKNLPLVLLNRVPASVGRLG